jgi:hypothetical protein
LASLAALASGFSLSYPFMRYEAAEQRIYEIVVHIGLAESHTGLFFQGIAMLRAVRQNRE